MQKLHQLDKYKVETSKRLEDQKVGWRWTR